MSEPRACKEAGRLPAHLQGVLDESEEARLVAHLDTCALCQQTLEQLAAGDMGLLETARQVKDDPPPVDPHLSHLLDRLGRRASSNRRLTNEPLPARWMPLTSLIHRAIRRTSAAWATMR